MDGQINEAIILAGGLGTRLGSVIGELPKPLAPVNDRPFLDHQLNFLLDQGVKTVVLSVGYKWELIHEEYGEAYKGLNIKYAVEKQRLGTGGGIQLALKMIEGENCFVLNGDTFFRIDLSALAQFHLEGNAECTIAANEMSSIDRYGTIDIGKNGMVNKFIEKKPLDKGVINGGIYCLNNAILESFVNSDSFSFEEDYLEHYAGSGMIRAKIFNAYFKDIGTPEDYNQFIEDMASVKGSKRALSELGIDKSWTLFLDRDGVINERLIDDYVKQINELEIIEGVPQAIAAFDKIFNRIVVVTNQQGIGKGMMDEDDLELIHGYMNNVFNDHGGNISKFYFAPQLASEGSNYRKPGTGMGIHAKEDFPEIDFSKSLMIGDSESDIEFGMKLGMTTVMLTNVRNISTKADYIFNNLRTVANQLKKP